jgi:hypothetical protein
MAAGAGLVPACWPDQEPVRPLGRDASQSCRAVSSPQTGAAPPEANLEVSVMLAETVDVVIGVDTHRDEHALAVVDARTGGVCAQFVVPADPRGYQRALAQAERLGHGTRAWAVEGTGGYGGCGACSSRAARR